MVLLNVKCFFSSYSNEKAAFHWKEKETDVVFLNKLPFQKQKQN